MIRLICVEDREEREERLPLAHRCTARSRREPGPTHDVCRKRRTFQLGWLEQLRRIGDSGQRSNGRWRGLDHWHPRDASPRRRCRQQKGSIGTGRHNQNSSQSQLGRRRMWSGDKITVQPGPYHSHVAWNCEVSLRQSKSSRSRKTRTCSHRYLSIHRRQTL